jgi:BASS family bile acid:Na+ symporter
MALALGLVWGDGAQKTEQLMLPALALVMTIAVMGITGNVFRSFKLFAVQGMTGIFMSYAIHGVFLIGLSWLIIQDVSLRNGFIIIAAVPPAVAVIPFSIFLKGDDTFSLFGTVGAYLGAFVITPLIALIFFGSGFISPVKLLTLILELIILPVILSRVLIWTRLARTLEPVKGILTNWSFFLVTYTIVGLNQKVFLSEPLSILPVAFVAAAGFFLLGWLIERAGIILGFEKNVVVSLVLLGTLKNYGLSGGLALSFFDEKTAIPSSVSVVLMIIYIIWLEYRKKRYEKNLQAWRQ